MRGRSIVLLLILLPAIMAGLSSTSASVVTEGFVIQGVMPAYSAEAVVIRNAAQCPMDLCGWSLTDGEGTLTFPSMIIPPDGDLFLLSGDDHGIWMEGTIVHMEDMEIRTGSLVLADKGDTLELRDEQGRTRDAMTYGTVSDEVEGWTGPPCPRPGRGKALLRTQVDTDSASDFSLSVLGRSEMVPCSFDAQVEPFLCPDEAKGRILRELLYASEEVLISIYEFDSEDITSVLIDRLEEGVEVTILIEGSPVGGISGSSKAQLATLIEAGCDVRVMRSADGYRRYDYLHCKYALIDGRRCTVTSENWVDAALENNRGWGVTLTCAGLVDHMRAMFEGDSRNGSPDIFPFHEAFPDVDAMEIAAFECEMLSPSISFMASVEPVISPDFSTMALGSLIRSAEERLYIEQMYFQEDWCDRLLPTEAVEGIDARVLLDSSWFNMQGDRDNAAVVQRLDDMGVGARLVSDEHPFSLIHNKGVIADDSVLVSSINFVDPALHDNREVGIIVHSPSVADHFAKAFLDDWSIDPLPPVLVANVTVDREGALILDATPSWDNSGNVNVTWSLDGEEMAGTFHILHLPSGTYHLDVTATDEHGNIDTRTFEVTIPRVEGHDGAILYLPMIAVAVTAIIRRSVKRLNVR
jgi:phosphatidylserine/phosphatidylglycerophosphate/cardiolipin synthase-like enzyme